MADIDVLIEDAQPINVTVTTAQPINVSLGEITHVYQGGYGSTDHLELDNVGVNTHAEIDTALAESATHIADLSNPHGVTKAQVGLSNVDNTSDLSKPVSTATQAALDTKQPVGDYATTNELHSHTNQVVLDATTASFTTADETKLEGIASGATVNSSDSTLLNRSNHTGAQAISTVTGLQTALDGKQAAGDYATNTALTTGLSGKANTSHNHTKANITDFAHAHVEADISDLGDYATATELSDGLDGKQDILVSGTNIKTINGSSVLGGGAIDIDTPSDYFVLASNYSPAADGLTDDTTPLQNALNALDTLGHGHLDLEGKTYATGKLSLKPNTGIINGTLKLKDNTDDYILSFDGHASRYQSGWYVENVTFDCNAVTNTTTAGAILVYASGTIYDRPTINNVKIKNVRSAAINFTGNGTTMTIQPRLFQVVIDGIGAYAGSKGIYLSAKVYDPSFVSVDVGRCDTGIELDGSAKIRFTDVRAWGNESVGMKMTNVVDFVGVNCELDKNFGHGVYTWDSTRINLVGSAISNNSYDDSENEFGLGAGHGSSQVYDGVVADGTSEIFLTGCRVGNEATNYQRYGVSGQGSSTIYIDGTTKFFNNGWGVSTGNTKSYQNLYRMEMWNGSALDPQTSTRTNLGFYSNEGAGFEFYKYSDADKPGKFAAIYGGATGQGSVGFTHFDGTNFFDRFALDSYGTLQLQGDIETTDSGRGVVLKSPDGTRYRIKVANGGTLTVTAV